MELAALFGKNAAALRGKSPVTADQIKEASEVGTHERICARRMPAIAPGRHRQGMAAPAAMFFYCFDSGNGFSQVSRMSNVSEVNGVR